MLFLKQESRIFLEWCIIETLSGSLEITFIVDWISLIFLRLVCLISARVLFYRGEYIEGEKRFNRFIYLVLLFVASIGALIFRPNLVRILLG